MINKRLLNRIAIERLKQIAPNEYQNCVRLATLPKLDYLLEIPKIIRYVAIQGYENNSVNGSIIIGTIYAILTPYKLFYPNMRIPIGLRKIIAKEMGFASSEMVNYYADVLPTYSKGNGKWLKKIESLADGYLETTKLNEHEI